MKRVHFKLTNFHPIEHLNAPVDVSLGISIDISKQIFAECRQSVDINVLFASVERRGSNKFLYLQISRVPSLHHPTQFLCLLLCSFQSLVMTESVKLDTVDTAICRCRCKNTSFLCSQKVLCTRIFHLQLFCILKALIGQFPGHYSHKTYSDSDELTSHGPPSLTSPYTIICKRSTIAFRLLQVYNLHFLYYNIIYSISQIFYTRCKAVKYNSKPQYPPAP